MTKTTVSDNATGMAIIWYIAIATSLFVVAGFAAMLGIGGGVLYTPLQVLYGIGIHEAAATSLFLIIILSFGATRIYRRAGKVDWKLAIALEAITIVGSFSGGFFSNLIPGKALQILLIAVLLATAYLMFKQDDRDHSHISQRRPWYLWKREHGDLRYDVNLLIALPLSLIAGLLSGMLGIGGGVIKVPMLTLLLCVPIDVAIATSAFMVGITAIGGFAGHVLADHWNWRMSLILAPTVFCGAQIGAHIMLKLDGRVLRAIFSVLIFVVALTLIIHQLRPAI